MRWLGGMASAVKMNLGKPQEMVRDTEDQRPAVPGPQRVRHNWATEQQQTKNVAVASEFSIRSPFGRKLILLKKHRKIQRIIQQIPIIQTLFLFYQPY